MEKKKNKLNNILSTLLIIVIVLLLSVTAYKLNKRHEDKLYNVLYSKIKYAAKECYLKKECESNIVLNELYDKNYLEIQFDPITKEELNKNLKIIIKDEKIEIE